MVSEKDDSNPECAANESRRIVGCHNKNTDPNLERTSASRTRTNLYLEELKSIKRQKGGQTGTRSVYIIQ